jgi:hypothetical protein
MIPLLGPILAAWIADGRPPIGRARHDEPMTMLALHRGQLALGLLDRLNSPEAWPELAPYPGDNRRRSGRKAREVGA